MSSGIESPRPPVRIVLTGFMGSGKTTVGRLLAVRLEWRFADLDDEVEARQGRSVPQIFAERGEAAFRAAETDALGELLQEARLVIALGGGAPEVPRIRELLAAAPDTAVVHLHAEFDLLYQRCAAQAENPHATARPLLSDRDAAAQRFARRRDLYAAVANHAACAEPSASAVAEAIQNALLPNLER